MVLVAWLDQLLGHQTEARTTLDPALYQRPDFAFRAEDLHPAVRRCLSGGAAQRPRPPPVRCE